MAVKNSTEFLEKIKSAKVTSRTCMITSDFSDAYTSCELSDFYPAIRKLARYCSWSPVKEELTVKLAVFVTQNCFMKIPTKIVRQSRGESNYDIKGNFSDQYFKVPMGGMSR